MSEENQKNNNNTATNIIIWLAGIMILIVGGLYIYGVFEDRNKETKYQNCMGNANNKRDNSYTFLKQGKLNVDEGAGTLMAIQVFEREYKKDISECKRKYYR